MSQDAHGQIGPRTRLCAVLGWPVRHSASPALQNAGIKALGLDWAYLALEVAPDQLRAAIMGAKAMRFIGLNLTVPHKLAALDLMDQLDQSAVQWGAVNTVVFEYQDSPGHWRPLAQGEPTASDAIRARGFNTDADAIARALREDLQLELRGAQVVLLGAGGAGRVAALRLAAEGVRQMHLLNRTRSKAEEIGHEIKRGWPEVAVSYDYPSGDVDLVLNATSLGLRADDPLPWDGRKFRLAQTRAVYDMIYRPARTPLLKQARAAGCRAANGLGMLLYQGVRALELWAGQAPPLAIMRQALEWEVYGPTGPEPPSIR